MSVGWGRRRRGREEIYDAPLRKLGGVGVGSQDWARANRDPGGIESVCRSSPAFALARVASSRQPTLPFPKRPQTPARRQGSS